MRIRTISVVAMALLAGTTLAFAGKTVTKDDAVALVKKTVTEIKAVGAEKSYAEINSGKFTNQDLYPVVQGLDGQVLAHGANKKLVGKNLIAVQDVDGKFFVKAMVEDAQKQATFWEDYKFVNPTTKKIEPKSMYCERVEKTIVCAGIYKS